MCSETVCNVMAATRCAVFCVQTCLFHTSSTLIGRSFCMNGASFSLSQRTLHFSWKRRSSAKYTILSRLQLGPCSAASGNIVAPTHKENAFALLSKPMFTKSSCSPADPGDHQSVMPHFVMCASAVPSEFRASSN